MNNFSLRLPLTHPSLKHLLQQKLLSIIAYYSDPSLIPLYLSKTRHCILYRCPIAFILAQNQPDSSVKIARQILNNLQSSPCLVTDRSIQVTVSCSPEGWLEFTIDDRSSATWLNYLFDIIFDYFPDKKVIGPENVINKPFFLLQYAHARCSALLRLGEQEKLIQLQNKQIPWFEEQFLQVHPSEQALIAQILAIVDGWKQANTKQFLQLATVLSKLVLIFEKDCRIFGEVQQRMPQLSQARLALIAISLQLLRFLSQQLDIIPLTQL